MATGRTVSDVQTRIAGYRVNHEYRGQHFTMLMQRPLGPSLRVRCPSILLGGDAAIAAPRLTTRRVLAVEQWDAGQRPVWRVNVVTAQAKFG